jgi:hypothetical protein
MSAATIHDLLHSLEQTIHDRFRLITQLVTSKTVEPDNTLINALIARIQALEKRLDAIPPAREELLPRSPMVGLEVSDKPVAVVPERASSDKAVTVTLPVSEQAVSPDEVVGEAATEDDISVIITAEAEVHVAMESEAEAEAEEAEAEEEEAEELTEFEYKGATYYRDSDNNVFTTDEDGELEQEPFGLWNEQKQRIVARP